MESSGTRNRLTFLDWLRGVGGIIMLQGHAFHSFLKPDLRGGAAYMLSQFFGGMPPAIFLFLTGVTLAFLMYSFERKGVSKRRADYGHAAARRLPVRHRHAVARAALAIQLAQPVDQSVEGGHPQLHGLRHRADVGDGAVHYGAAGATSARCWGC